MSPVITFSNPDRVSGTQLYPLFPLLTRAAAVGIVDREMGDSRMCCILFEKSDAVVGAGVVQQNQFKVLKRLVQNAVNSLAEESRMIVIRHRDADRRSLHSIPRSDTNRHRQWSDSMVRQRRSTRDGAHVAQSKN